ncbi:MAG: hypothetical protein KDA90_15860 [Planctomycetaceae bacterium]|nr:hypothetical protein [Planctomycetaceae bacterium]
MSLLNWLRKLGILRFGAESATYHNAKERPISIQESGVFDSEKDLIYGGQSPNPPKPEPPKAPPTKPVE